MGVFREGPGKKKVLMVIGPLCSISVEGVIRRLRWGTGRKMWQFLAWRGEARQGEARQGEASVGIKISPNSPKD
jgi:hypothetical protein